MNTKIYNKILDLIKSSPQILYDNLLMQNAISSIFSVDVQIKNSRNVIDNVNVVDHAVLENYFANVWHPKTKQYKYSGLSLVDEVNLTNPRSVLDLGCGFNEFKGKINNLIGIDPYNNRADTQCDILSYRSNTLFDVIICLGSINFGSVDKILTELDHAVSLTTPGGLMFFRVNPGKMHEAIEAKWIEFFNWTPEFILNSANQFGCQVISMKPDKDRFYFVLKRNDK